MKVLKPFEELTQRTKSGIMLGAVVILLIAWCIASIGSVHLFPSIPQVLTGFADLYRDGLVVHIFSSLGLFIHATIISVIISLVLAYLTPIAALKPLGTFISKLRYLPLTGIAFYISILINDARAVQTWILVVFMSTYLTTSLLGMVKDIPEEEFDHAKTLGCSRWEILLEVVISCG